MSSESRHRSRAFFSGHLLRFLVPSFGKDIKLRRDIPRLIVFENVCLRAFVGLAVIMCLVSEADRFTMVFGVMFLEPFLFWFRKPKWLDFSSDVLVTFGSSRFLRGSSGSRKG